MPRAPVVSIRQMLGDLCVPERQRGNVVRAQTPA